MKPPITNWSFSVLKDFEACPYRVFLAKVEKAEQPEPEGDDHPLVRGTRLHTEAENAIRGDGPITHGLRHFKARIGELQERYAEGLVEVEQKWGFNENWEPVDFFDPNVRCRIVCDVVEHHPEGTIDIDDWKGGKSWGNEVKHTEQKQLYGVATLLRYPNVSHARSTMRYLDENKSKSNAYTRPALSTLLARWQTRADRMLGALTFPPKPNRGNCAHCPYGRVKGTGACPYAVGDDE